MKLTKKEVNPILQATYPDYTGRKFFLVPQEKITFYDLNWGGGTRNYFKAITNDGIVHGMYIPAPWDNPKEGYTMSIPQGMLIVKHAFFCGQDMGITVYCNPSDFPKWLTNGGCSQ